MDDKNTTKVVAVAILVLFAFGLGYTMAEKTIKPVIVTREVLIPTENVTRYVYYVSNCSDGWVYPTGVVGVGGSGTYFKNVTKAGAP